MCLQYLNNLMYTNIISHRNYMRFTVMGVIYFCLNVNTLPAKSHGSVGSVANLRIGGRWLYPQFSKHSFQGLMIVIATGFIPLSPLFVVSTMIIKESSQWLGKNIVWSIVQKNSRKAFQKSMDRCIGCCEITEILLKTALNTI